MKRLTKRLDSGEAVYYLYGFGAFDEIEALDECADRLAAYEDTGLEPEEVTAIKNAIIGQEVAKITEFDGISIQRLQELAQAEKDGRLVVLPCKAGDCVFVDCRRAIVEEFFGYETERYLHAQFYDNMQYIDIPFDEIGKTAFLTREEAEAALKEREEADNEAN